MDEVNSPIGHFICLGVHNYQTLDNLTLFLTFSFNFPIFQSKHPLSPIGGDDFSYFSSNFSHFLPHFGPPGRQVKVANLGP